MKTSNIAILAVPTLVAASIALSGCGRRTNENPTTISYRQLGVCKSYKTPTTTETARANEGFAVFKIETIDNSKPSSDFNLDPERFYVDQSPPEMKTKNLSFQTRRFMDPNPRFAQAMGVTGLARAAVPANGKLDINSYLVVPLPLNNPTGAPEAKQYSFDLVYDTTDAQLQAQSAGGIFLTKTNPPDTKYSVVENCKELPFK